MGKRHGRPRQAGERHPSGKLVQAAKDTGPTPERLRLIRFLIGDATKGDAESPMGVLVAHGLVEQQVREAVTTPYLKAKKKCFGTYGPAMPGDGTERGHDSSDNDKSERAARDHIARCDQVLLRLPNRKGRDLFDNFVVRERFPEWMQPRPGAMRVRLTKRDDEGNLKPVEIPELKLLLGLLEQLATSFNIKPRPERIKMVTTQSEPGHIARNFQQSEGL